MTRTISLNTQTAISSQTGIITHLIKLEFASGIVYLTTSPMDILWNGNNFIALGGALSFDGVTENGNVIAPSVGLRLDGVDRTILALILADEYLGRSVTIWRVYMSGGTIIDSPLQYGPMLMTESFRYEETRVGDKPTATIRTSLSSRTIVGKVSRGILPTLNSHQRFFPTDTFFQFTASLVGKRIQWGGNVLTLPRGGSGDGTGNTNPGALTP